jgi:hypothetical protein
VLLEDGKITLGEVFKSGYQRFGLRKSYRLIYKFKAKEPSTSEEKTYWGSAEGPTKYYAGLAAGDTVEVIYGSLNPKINCEIREFLNNPNYRQTFNKTGKLHLLDKFKDKYEMEDYSFEEWYKLQWQK